MRLLLTRCRRTQAAQPLLSSRMATEAHGEIAAVYISNREPSLRELLDDPIARLLMASDRVRVEQVMLHLRTARRRVAALGALRGQDQCFLFSEFGA
jgi:hypothetical protein